MPENHQNSAFDFGGESEPGQFDDFFAMPPSSGQIHQ
jgi:hypothetical protein